MLLCYCVIVRTTIDIADEAYYLAKAIARDQNRSLGDERKRRGNPKGAACGVIAVRRPAWVASRLAWPDSNGYTNPIRHNQVRVSVRSGHARRFATPVEPRSRRTQLASGCRGLLRSFPWLRFSVLNGVHCLLRIEELRLSASAAAEKVKRTGSPFFFNPMNSRERRVIHLALRGETELRSESAGLKACSRSM